MNITVCLGANEGNAPRLAQAVRELGRWIGESGNALIYGGSACGLMGELAKSVLDVYKRQPLTRSIISEADAWEIAQPEPMKPASSILPSFTRSCSVISSRCV